MGTLKEGIDKYYGRDNFFINEIVDHPNYDDFGKKRPFTSSQNIKHAVMTVGGWFDAEDLRGLHIYKTIEKIILKLKTHCNGAFSHGGWSYEMGKHFHNEVYFGDSIATFYQKI